MNNNSEYKVSFGSDAWTIDYEDHLGKFTFVFGCDIEEFDATGDTKRLFLSGGAAIQGERLIHFQTQAESERLSNILQRIRQYLSGIGYIVEVTE